MMSMLLVLLLLAQTEGPDSLLGGRLYALGTCGTLLFPEGVGALSPGAFASVDLGMDNAR